jgi:hypothetical protein
MEEIISIITREVIKYVDWPTLLNLRLVVRFDFEAYLAGEHGKRFMMTQIKQTDLYVISIPLLPNRMIHGPVIYTPIDPKYVVHLDESTSERSQIILDDDPFIIQHMHERECSWSKGKAWEDIRKTFKEIADRDDIYLYAVCAESDIYDIVCHRLQEFIVNYKFGLQV